MLKVFDRYGERSNRNKARLKYLVQKLGLEEVLRLVVEEKVANKVKIFPIDVNRVSLPYFPLKQNYPTVKLTNENHYKLGDI